MEWREAHPCRGTHVLSMKWRWRATRRISSWPGRLHQPDRYGGKFRQHLVLRRERDPEAASRCRDCRDKRPHLHEEEVGATSPLPGNNPYTEISRIYGLRPQPPKAPTDFHEVSISPPWPRIQSSPFWWSGRKENPSNEDSFVVRYSGTRSGSLNAAGESAVAANSVMAILSLDAGYTYNLYVAAVNSAGEAASNTITVIMPRLYAAHGFAVGGCGLTAHESNPNFGLSIEGKDFGASEMVEVTVDWKVGDEVPVSSTLDPQTTSSLGYFQVWFASGVTPDGICPISVPDGESQPPQRLSVGAYRSYKRQICICNGRPVYLPRLNVISCHDDITSTSRMGEAIMPWYKCTVNEVGPASDASETPWPGRLHQPDRHWRRFRQHLVLRCERNPESSTRCGDCRDKRPQRRRGGRHRTPSRKQPIYRHQPPLPARNLSKPKIIHVPADAGPGGRRTGETARQLDGDRGKHR